MTKYYTYVDFTTEEIPRPFYVGKGKKNRLGFNLRNKLHSNISAKYGRNRRIVFESEIESEAFDKEIELIALYKTNVMNGVGYWGANFTDGGDGASGVIQSQETRKKKSTTSKNAWLNGKFESRKFDGQKNPFFGHRHSDETKKKIGSKSLGRKNKYKSKAVIQMTLDGKHVQEYGCVSDAAKITKIDRHAISKACKNILQSAGGFTWKFKNLSSL